MAEETAEHQNGAAAALKEASSFSSFKPQLVVPSLKADEAVQFYKAAFGAEEVKRSSYPKRKADQERPQLLCAELKIGGSNFLVCDQNDDSSVAKDGAGGVVFFVETDDVEAAVSKAVKAGATAASEIAEEDGGCGGGLVGKVKDPWGVVWAISSAEKKCCEPQA